LCDNLEPVNCIKNSVIFKEGDPNKYVYFVRNGEL
jgi:CRP-like cAMP-binding protein